MRPIYNNSYALGKVKAHNVVIAVLPDGEYGASSAAAVARDMLHTFPNIRIGLLVGIGGGAPSPRHDIRLGDVVVSSPRHRTTGGVLHYDYAKTIQEQSIQITGYLNLPPMVLRTAVNGLKAAYESDGHTIEAAIEHAVKNKPRLTRKYMRPDQSRDILYHNNPNPSNLIARPNRSEDEDNPAIHYGLIASANQLIRDAAIRDKIAAETDVLCFETEAAGLMNHFPCLVVRGICDYSDSHGDTTWQGYAAMAAAAYTKDLLCRIPPNKVKAEKKMKDVLSVINLYLI
ncbi:purine and uridine phosphorylase [Trichoderma compactum]